MNVPTNYTLSAHGWCWLGLWAIAVACAGPQDKGDTDATKENQSPDSATEDVTVSSDNSSDDSSDSSLPDTGQEGTRQIQVNLESTAKPAIVYVIWVENKAGTFIQNLYICNRLLNGYLTGDALPYWALSKKANSTIDGLSGATILPRFSISRTLSSEAGQQFTVFAEVDHSFDSNDWFNNQPAILFAADVDLNNPKASYTLLPVGWTKGKQNSYQSVDGAPTSANGELNTELRYLTHHAEDGGFGLEDTRSAMQVIDSLTVSIQ
ncbi:MAG: hypothetical protein JXR76_30400 [Deltaproteobacteria bacterium]|nr:hypothetical protein [Deltaproteobacteria bacterium]